MHRRPVHDSAPRNEIAPEGQALEVERQRPVMRRDPELLPLFQEDHGVHRGAERYRRSDNGVQHRLHVRGRVRDDAEHAARRRLLLQRLAKFRRARPHLLEESHILDGNDGLVRERFDELDLLGSKRKDVPAHEHDDADLHTLPH